MTEVYEGYEPGRKKLYTLRWRGRTGSSQKEKSRECQKVERGRKALRR